MAKPSESFEKILKSLRFCASLVGCNVFLPSYRINVITVIAATSIISYYIFSFVTVAQLYQEDWMIILEAFCLASSVLQGAVKLVSTIAEASTIRRIYFLLQEIYAEYELHGAKYVKALNASCRRIRKVLKFIFVAYMFSGAGIAAMPFIMLAVSGQRYLIMKVHFPYLDVTTTSGYYCTLAIHSVFMFVGTFGLFASDLLIVICLMQSFLFTEIFKLKIEDFNELVAVSEKADHKCKNISKHLIDIVKWHQIYSDFTKTCNEIFYSVVTVMVATAGISIIFSIFIILTGDWPGAYPYLLIGFYTLYVYCILGTKIETCVSLKNDEFCTEIYNTSWYGLNVSQQKIVRLMLMQSQRPQTLYVAGVFPLSVKTALQITKIIYSTFTMVIRVIQE